MSAFTKEGCLQIIDKLSFWIAEISAKIDRDVQKFNSFYVHLYKYMIFAIFFNIVRRISRF
jgi:hypothetical protein